MRKLLPFAFLFLISQGLLAQVSEEVLENNPPSLKWYQVNTPHFRVIFPKGFEDQAQRMANTFEHIREAEAKSLGSVPRKISVILQNQSAVSNGFVSILPRRSEFYTMPSQNYNFQGTNDWLNLLASHEYRHIVQYQHATRGFNKAFYYLFGGLSLAGMSQAAAPQWFWEGDAVATETAFTHSGRGRIPNFGLLFRTNLLEGRTFNYHKQYLRSYKHNIPDHYVLGYHMVSYLRKKTNDPNIWGKITARSWNVPFIPFAFSNAIKKETGLHVVDLYNEMATSLKKEWQTQIDTLKLTSFESIIKRKQTAYTDYQYPQPLNDGTVIALRNGIGDIDQFVMIRQQQTKVIFTPGFINDAGMLSANEHGIAWTEYGYDPRWLVKNYSRIKFFDPKENKVRIIGHPRSRFGSVALSPDGSRMVAVHSGTDYRTEVMILDLASEQVVKTFSNPENAFYSMPRWSEDSKQIVVLKTKQEGRTISIFDFDSGAEKELLPYTHENIGHPILCKSYVLFNAPVNGIDNIHAIDIENGNRYQITVSKYGAYNPSVSPDGKTIYYNDQTKNGLDIVTVPFDPASWKSFQATPNRQGLDDHLAEQEGYSTLLDNVPQEKLPVTRYTKLKGLINPYTWGLNITNDLDINQINVAANSKDLLSTTSLSAGYSYDITERTGVWNAGLSYQGLYPILDVQFLTGKRSTSKSGFGNTIEFDWNETTAQAGLRIPLVLTRSKFLQQFTIGSALGFTRTSSFRNEIIRDNFIVDEGTDRIAPVNDSLVYQYKDLLSNGDLVFNHFRASYDIVQKTSPRDFLYRWGLSLDFELINTPFETDFRGQLWALRSTVYLPGLFKHHYLYGRLAYQKSMQSIETDIYTFRNRIAKPRGHSYPSDETFTTISVNYAFPLWYPDIAIGPVLNLKRIKTNLFYDYGQGTGKQFYYHTSKNMIYYGFTDATYQSIGAETTVDFNVMRFLPQMELGVRTTYRTENVYNSGGLVVEFVIGAIGF